MKKLDTTTSAPIKKASTHDARIKSPRPGIDVDKLTSDEEDS